MELALVSKVVGWCALAWDLGVAALVMCRWLLVSYHVQDPSGNSRVTLAQLQNLLVELALPLS